MKPKLDTLLRAMEPVVRPIMLTKFRPDCCIATCKILREVFSHYGYKARPFAVSVEIYNQPMLDLMESGVHIPDNREERVALFDSVGAWGVGIRRLDERGSGHLVLSVNGKLVDGALDQASRPERNMPLPLMLFFDAPPGFFAERVKGQKIRGMIDGLLVVYRREASDSYRTSINWREPYAGAPSLYREILKHIATNLEEQRDRVQAAAARPLTEHLNC